jgi:peptidoglycan/LPS O-acetylase OafA/YrhL
VVVVHWLNFYPPGPLPDARLMPLGFLLWPVYKYGWWAVDLFFCLSGFVFFWLYSQKLQTRAVGAKEFFVLRFSRLYPLHLTTLLFVAVGQWWMVQLLGVPFRNAANDLGHFIAQLFFVSAWGLTVSFNEPVWSVSVEIFLYLTFFVVCRLRCVRWWQLLIYAGVGEFCFIHYGRFILMGAGLVSFFMGGLAFQALTCLQKHSPDGRSIRWLGLLVILLWLLVPAEVTHGYAFQLWQKIFGPATSGFWGYLGRGVERFSAHAYALVLFPSTVCFLALWETHRGTLGRRAAILGDISYSTYLIHYPLQLLFVLLGSLAGFQLSAFASPIAMLVFFLVLIPLSLCSYHYLERPAQSFLRKRLLGEK